MDEPLLNIDLNMSLDVAKLGGQTGGQKKKGRSTIFISPGTGSEENVNSTEKKEKFGESKKIR